MVFWFGCGGREGGSGEVAARDKGHGVTWKYVHRQTGTKY